MGRSIPKIVTGGLVCLMGLTTVGCVVYTIKDTEERYKSAFEVAKKLKPIQKSLEYQLINAEDIKPDYFSSINDDLKKVKEISFYVGEGQYRSFNAISRRLELFVGERTQSEARKLVLDTRDYVKVQYESNLEKSKYSIYDDFWFGLFGGGVSFVLFYAGVAMIVRSKED